MISQVIDVTDIFNASNAIVLDTGGNRFMTFYVNTPTGAISFTGTNDGGAVQGESDGSAATATGFVSIGGYNLTAPLTVVTSINATGLIRIDCQCKYIKLAGSSVTLAKLIVMTGKLL